MLVALKQLMGAFVDKITWVYYTDKNIMRESALKKKISIISVSLVLILVLTWLFSQVEAADIQDFVAGFGPWAPVVYMGLFALLPAVFFPVAVLALAGGLLFGLWAGSIYTFLGAMINCTVMFWLARTVGYTRVKALVESKLSEKWQNRLNAAAGREGFLLLIILRLIPAVPYNLINYAFGLSRMSYGAYLLASAMGIIPGTLVFINIGDKAMDVNSPGFWVAIGLLVLLLVVTTALGKKLFPNKENSK